jgi:chitinase
MIVCGYLYEKAKWSPIDDHFKKLTHLFYAFAKIEGLNGKVVEQFEQVHRLPILKKHHPSLKAVVSIGGWGAGYFSEVAADPALLSVFVESTMDLV